MSGAVAEIATLLTQSRDGFDRIRDALNRQVGRRSTEKKFCVQSTVEDATKYHYFSGISACPNA
jgi:hypothetical protein